MVRPISFQLPESIHLRGPSPNGPIGPTRLGCRGEGGASVFGGCLPSNSITSVRFCPNFFFYELFQNKCLVPRHQVSLDGRKSFPVILKKLSDRPTYWFSLLRLKSIWNKVHYLYRADLHHHRRFFSITLMLFFFIKTLRSAKKSKIIWVLQCTELPEIENARQSKSMAPPPYSPNASVKLVDFLATYPSCECFPGHRGDYGNFS